MNVQQKENWVQSDEDSMRPLMNVQQKENWVQSDEDSMRPLMNVMPLVAIFRRFASLDMRINVTKLSLYFIMDAPLCYNCVFFFVCV